MQKNFLRGLCLLAVLAPIVYRAYVLFQLHPAYRPDEDLTPMLVAGVLGLLPALGLGRVPGYCLLWVSAVLLRAAAEASLYGTPPSWVGLSSAFLVATFLFALIWLVTALPKTALEREADAFTRARRRNHVE